MEERLFARRMALRLGLVLVALVGAAETSLAIPITWTGLAGTSLWKDAANWSPAQVPGAADDALLGAFNTEYNGLPTDPLVVKSFTGTGTLKISGGRLSVTSLSTIGALDMTNGSLGGAVNVTVTGPTTTSFTYGDHRGTGTTFLQAAATISSSGFRLDGGRTLTNQNALTWSGGQIVLNNTYDNAGASGGVGAGTINNALGATFTASGDGAGSIDVTDQGAGDTGADALFINTGTFTKSGSTGGHQTAINVPFTHTGPVQIQSGILNFTRSGTHPGSFSVNAGTILNFGGGTHALSGTLTAPGTVRLTGGPTVVNFNSAYSIAGLEIQDGRLNLGANTLSVGTLSQANGSITGTANLTVTGAAAFTYGDHRGTGTTILQGASTISSSGFRLDGGRTLTNQNALTWSGGQIVLNNTYDNAGAGGGAGSGTINNAMGATFTASGDGAGSIDATDQGAGDTGADALFINTGTFTKSGSTGGHQTAINVPFTHTGPVQIQSGILNFTRSGTHPGSFSVNAGTILNFGGGTHALSGTLTAPGTVRLTGGPTVVNFNSAYSIAGLEIQDGRLNLGANTLSVGTLSQANGSISGTANLTVTGAAAFTYGDHRGTGTTILQGASTISSSGFRLDGGRTLTNQNALTWSGGQIVLNNTYDNAGASGGVGAGTINNALGATFTASGDGAGSIDVTDQGAGDTGADALFINTGTFTKSGSTGGHQTAINVPFTHTGPVQIQSGILNFTRSGTHPGSFSVNAGTILNFGGGTHALSGTLTAPGTVRLTGGPTVVNFNSAYSIAGLDLQDGRLNLGANTLSVGTLSQANGSITGTANLTVTGAAAFTYGDHRGTGTTILQGASTISSSGFRLDGGRTLTNQNALTWSGGQIVLNNTYDNIGAGGGVGAGTINNALGATFTASGDGAGSIDVTDQGAGDTGADALFINTGTFTKSGSTGGHQTAINVPFTHTGPVQIQSGILNFTRSGTHPGSFSVNAGTILNFGGGTHALSGTLTAPGTVRLTGGSTVVNFNSAYSIAGLDIQDGRLNLGANTLSVGTLSQANGSISGTANLTVTGPAAFTYGDHRGTGTTILQGASTISSSGFRLDGGRTLTNQNALTWSGGQIVLNNTYDNIGAGGGVGAGTINNALGATFTISGDGAGSIDVTDQGAGDTGASALFVNAGTLIKTSSTSGHQTAFNVPLTNTGTIDVQSGIIKLPDNFTNNGTLKGVAKFATTLLTNAGHVAPGASPGTLTLNGNFTQPGGGFLDIELSSTASFDLFTITGTATLGGTLALHCVPGNCNVNTNDEFIVLHSTGTLSGTFAGTSSSGFRPGFAFDVLYDYAGGNVKVKVTNGGTGPLLAVVKAGSGFGTVVSSDGFINCGSACVHGYDSATPVTLTATANAGSTFVGWLGACHGTATTCMTTVSSAVTVKATFVLGAISQHVLDVDGNTQFNAATDGLLAIRWMLGLTDTSLTSDAVAMGAPRNMPAQIAGYLEDVGPLLDIDLNGILDPVTDGVLIIRYLLGITGTPLINSAVAPDANRSSASDITNYLNTLVQ